MFGDRGICAEDKTVGSGIVAWRLGSWKMDLARRREHFL
jgi:hypothetical protein